MTAEYIDPMFTDLKCIAVRLTGLSVEVLPHLMSAAPWQMELPEHPAQPSNVFACAIPRSIQRLEKAKDGSLMSRQMAVYELSCTRVPHDMTPGHTFSFLIPAPDFETFNTIKDPMPQLLKSASAALEEISYGGEVKKPEDHFIHAWNEPRPVQFAIESDFPGDPLMPLHDMGVRLKATLSL